MGHGRFTIPIKYSNQDFDEKQQRATELADEDRRAGRPSTEFGYSASSWDRACAEYKAAQDAYWGKV